MKISISDLRQKIQATLKEKGFNESDANRIADVLIWADMSGITPMGIAKMVGSEPVQTKGQTPSLRLSETRNFHSLSMPIMHQHRWPVRKLSTW